MSLVCTTDRSVTSGDNGHSDDSSFQLTGDIVSGTLLVHNLIGKFLQRLSKSNVDPYAFFSVLYLGKALPIHAEQELEIANLVHNRTGRCGFYVKLLQLGWDIADIAAELTKKREGSAALMLIAAFTTGGTHYDAAYGLSQMLEALGCPTEKMPSVDQLKTIVNYLAPIVHGHSFGAYFEKTIAAATKESTHSIGDPECLDALEVSGLPSQWANACARIELAARTRDHLCIITSQRGAWLAAYASFFLRMAVEIKFGDKLVWTNGIVRGESEHGSLIIQLEGLKTASRSRHELIRLQGDGILRLDHSLHTSLNRCCVPMEFGYPLEKALEHILDNHRYITEDDVTDIQYVISTLTIWMCMKVRICTAMSGNTHQPHKITGNFHNKLENCVDVLKHMNIDEKLATKAARDQEAYLEWDVLMSEPDSSVATSPAVRAICSMEDAESIGRIVQAFASTALALSQCQYEPAEVRLNSRLMQGEIETPWSKGAVRGSSLAHQMLISHLSVLLHGEDAFKPDCRMGKNNEFNYDPDSHRRNSTNVDGWQNMGSPTDSLFRVRSNPDRRPKRPATGVDRITLDANTLGISAGSVSIYYKVILDQECFDKSGRPLAISSGRFSVNGSLRPVVRLQDDIRSGLLEKDWKTHELRACKLPFKSQVKPHYLQSNHASRISMGVRLDENCDTQFTFFCSLDWDLDNGITQKVAVSPVHAIHGFLTCQVSDKERCSHDRNSSFIVPRQTDGYVGAFLTTPRQARDEHAEPADSCTFFALKGAQFEQLFQTELLDYRKTYIQRENVCLSCTYEEATLAGRTGGCVNIIMT